MSLAEDSQVHSYPTSSKIPEFAIFEDQKENILPLKEGRSAAALSQLFSTSPEKRTNILAQGHAQFQHELSQFDELDDPLDVYNRYIRWTIENYPQGHNHESNLVPLLENVTRLFKDDGRYSNDPRYLKCWLLYTKYVEHKKDIFIFLMKNEIGQDLAAFYEEYALTLEGLERYDEAKKIYELGINRRAQPLERLNRQHKQFQARMMQRALEAADDEPSGTRSRDILDTNLNRTILGAKSSSSSSRSVHSSAAGGVGRPLGGTQDRKPNTRLQVFVDPEPSQNVESVVSPSPGGWQELGTTISRKKENIHEPAKWKGTILKQKPGVRPPVSEKIEVYRDETVADNSTPLEPRPSSISQSLNNLVEPSEAALLIKNPLKNHKPSIQWPKPTPNNQVNDSCLQEPKSTGLSELSANPSKRIPSATATSQSFISNKPSQPEASEKKCVRPERLHVDLARCYTDDPNPEIHEISFEEIRAKCSKYQIFKESPDTTVDAVNKTVGVDIHDSKHREPSGAPSEDYFNNKNGNKKARSVPSPTVNTKAALADIMEIFNQPLKHEHENDDSSSEEDETSAYPQYERIGVYRDEDEFPIDTRNNENIPPRQPLGVISVVDSAKPSKQTRIINENDPIAFGFEAGTQKKILSASVPNKGASAHEKFKVLTDVSGVQQSSTVMDVDETRIGSFSRKTVLQSTPHHLSGSRFAGYRQPGNAPISSSCSSQGAPFDIMTPITERDSLEYDKSVITFDRTISLTSHDANTFHGFGSAATPFHLPEGYTINNLMEGTLTESVETQNKNGVVLTTLSPHHALEKILKGRQQKSALPTPSNPCNPMDLRLITAILSSQEPTFETYQGLHDFRQHHFKQAKFIEKVAKRKLNQRHNNISGNEADDNDTLKLGNESYSIEKKLGEGGSANVYLVVNINSDSLASLDVDNLDLETSDCRNRALKVAVPSSGWEFYILYQLHSRLPPELTISIVKPKSFYMYADEGYLLMEYCDQGTILDAVNLYTKDGGALDELLVIFFTVELLKLINGLHTVRAIHGDIKADNILVRLEETDLWAPQYDPSGGNGWFAKGIKLIDFGRGIDMSLFPSNMEFVGDWETDKYDCPEMRSGQPWSYQVDYWGAARVIYCMLFGRYMETVEENKRIKPLAQFKRYWQVKMWLQLFDVLLNTKMDSGSLPIIDKITALQHEFEMYLKSNCNCGGKNLKSLLKKLEIAILERNKRF